MNQDLISGLEIMLFRYKCIGCMYCISIAPEIFSISVMDGKVTERGNENTDTDITTFFTSYSNRAQMEQSVKVCPVGAIAIKRNKRSLL